MKAFHQMMRGLSKHSCNVHLCCTLTQTQRHTQAGREGGGKKGRERLQRLQNALGLLLAASRTDKRRKTPGTTVPL